MTQNDIERDRERERERKEHGASRGQGGMSWLWIAVVVVLILLLVWWLWPDDDEGLGVTDDTAGEETYSEPTLDEDDEGATTSTDRSTSSSDRTEAVSGSPGIATREPEDGDATDTDDGMSATSDGADQTLPLREILDDPDGWSGRQVDATVETGGMASDQAFWIIDGEDRLLALIVGASGGQRMSIDSGQRLQLKDAQVHKSQDVVQDLSGQVDDETRQLLDDQQVLLVVSEGNISMR